MNYPGRQAPDGGEFFSAGNRAVRFYAGGYVLADSNHMRDFAVFAGAHRNLANQPMVGLAVKTDGLPFNSVNAAGS